MPSKKTATKTTDSKSAPAKKTAATPLKKGTVKPLKPTT